MKEPHTALFVAPTGLGKTHLALSLLETEYIYILLELVISGRQGSFSMAVNSVIHCCS